MRFSKLVGASLLSTLAVAAPAPSPVEADDATGTSTFPAAAATDTDVALSVLDDLLTQAQVSAGAALNGTIEKRGTCTLQNLTIRREWTAFSTAEKKSYINAVLCLQKKTANTPSSLAAGAKTRYDDFVATHINQTLTIHLTGTFLSWHRYYTWIYEQSLKTECGYTGSQPYWDWSRSAITGVENYPVFDGSDTSISGNGAFVANQSDVNLGGNGFPDYFVAAGSGGGCVTSGPFKNMSVNLGPVALPVPGGISIGAAYEGTDFYAYNPRCLKRSFSTAINRRFANASSIVNLILKNNNIADFQLNMQGVPGSGELGVHGGGHFTMGGDPGRDPWASPGDPLFYLHHAMIDRVWWLWQLIDPANRMASSNAVAGTNTFLNYPPSANTTLEDIIDVGYSRSPNVKYKIGDLLSTTSGPFCYIYA